MIYSLHFFGFFLTHHIGKSIKMATLCSQIFFSLLTVAASHFLAGFSFKREKLFICLAIDFVAIGVSGDA